LYIWQLKDNDLSGVAFIDTHIYICSLTTLKNLILVGDVLKSVTLYRFQSDLKVLSIVSKVSATWNTEHTEHRST
jgi:cleavage and polyadenylation specificity factor subunit 1